MPTLNHVYLSGNLTKDPELRFVGNNGTALASFAIGVSRTYEAGGEKKRESSFFDCKCWSELAQRVAELSKGAKVIIEGRLQQETWQASDSSQRTKVVVICDRVVPVA
jgi:single-strand DNA-binding protein